MLLVLHFDPTRRPLPSLKLISDEFHRDLACSVRRLRAIGQLLANGICDHLVGAHPAEEEPRHGSAPRKCTGGINALDGCWFALISANLVMARAEKLPIRREATG